MTGYERSRLLYYPEPPSVADSIRRTLSEQSDFDTESSTDSRRPSSSTQVLSRSTDHGSIVSIVERPLSTPPPSSHAEFHGISSWLRQQLHEDRLSRGRMLDPSSATYGLIDTASFREVSLSRSPLFNQCMRPRTSTEHEFVERITLPMPVNTESHGNKKVDLIKNVALEGVLSQRGQAPVSEADLAATTAAMEQLDMGEKPESPSTLEPRLQCVFIALPIGSVQALHLPRSDETKTPINVTEDTLNHSLDHPTRSKTVDQLLTTSHDRAYLDNGERIESKVNTQIVNPVDIVLRPSKSPITEGVATESQLTDGKGIISDNRLSYSVQPESERTLPAQVPEKCVLLDRASLTKSPEPFQVHEEDLDPHSAASELCRPNLQGLHGLNEPSQHGDGTELPQTQFARGHSKMTESTRGRGSSRGRRPSTSARSLNAGASRIGASSPHSRRRNEGGCFDQGDANTITGTSVSQEGDRYLFCPYCVYDFDKHQRCLDFKFRNLAEVKQHIKRKHTVPEHYCFKCHESFKSSEELQQEFHRRTCESRQEPPEFSQWLSRQRLEETCAKEKAGNDKDKAKRSVEETWNDLYQRLFGKSPPPSSAYVHKYERHEGYHFQVLIEVLARKFCSDNDPQRMYDTLQEAMRADPRLLPFSARKSLEQAQHEEYDATSDSQPTVDDQFTPSQLHQDVRDDLLGMNLDNAKALQDFTSFHSPEDRDEGTLDLQVYNDNLNRMVNASVGARPVMHRMVSQATPVPYLGADIDLDMPDISMTLDEVSHMQRSRHRPMDQAVSSQDHGEHQNADLFPSFVPSLVNDTTASSRSVPGVAQHRLDPHNEVYELDSKQDKTLLDYTDPALYSALDDIVMDPDLTEEDFGSS